MSEPSNGAWPFQEIPEEEGLDISAIFGNSSAAPQGDPFAPPAAAQSVPSSPTPVAQEITPAVAATSQPTTAPIAKAPVEAPAENPIAAAFEQKTAENTKKGLLEKPPVFYHKGVKEEIDDPSMTFEELRIRKSDDFTDLEEGKRVISCWTMRWMCRAAAEKRRSFLSSTSDAQTASRSRPSASISCGEWRQPN